jgi:hypothetical protein
MDVQKEAEILEQSSFLTIWTKPRATIRQIVYIDPTQHVLLLAALAGIGNAFSRGSMRMAPENSGDFMSLLAISFVVGPIGGIIILYVAGAILRWTGSKLGGQADSENVRAAVAWSYIPMIAYYVLFIPAELLIFLAGNGSTGPFWDILWFGFSLFGLVAAIGLTLWSLVILVIGLSEVHHFSVGRAVATALIPLLVLVLIPVTLIVILTLLGPQIGDVFGRIATDLGG